MADFRLRPKRWLLGGLSLLLLLIPLLLLKMLLTPSHQPRLSAAAGPAPMLSPTEQQQAAERLAQALRLRTISADDAPPDREQLLGLHRHLQAAYPLAHSAMRRETVNELALLYTWPGQDPSAKPYLLTAHQDVVPIEAGTESGWQQPPFAGVVSGGYIWGRGSIDDKSSLLAMFEAIERLIRAGYKPRRSLYIAAGHDEETTGIQGAKALAQTLEQRGIHFEFAVDEGMAVVQDIVPGVKLPVALIGLGEKGYLSAELAVRSEGGHSSTPPRHTAVGRLSRAVARLEDHPFPASLKGATGRMFYYLGTEMTLPLRLVMTNLWLLEPVLLYVLEQGGRTNATIRTTTAPTMLQGSPKENVLAQRATAVVNFRLLPGDTVAAVLAHIRRVVDDPGVEVTALPNQAREASPESSDRVPAFATLCNTIHSVFPTALIAPALTIGATDGRYYTKVADQVYRFQPLLFRSEDLDGLHGSGERLAIENYARAIAFYEQLIRTADASP